MKVVLFSVLILIAVIQTATKLGKPSYKVHKAENRRKTRKFLRELNIGDPFPQRYNREFQEFSLPKIGRETHSVKRKFRLRNGLTSRRESSLDRKLKPMVNFRSPKQLQEYLFSEAGTANYIPMTDDPKWINQGSSENSTYSPESNFCGELDHYTASESEESQIKKPFDRIEMNREKQRRLENERKKNYPYHLIKFLRRPIHTCGLPCRDPPSPYRTRTQFHHSKLQSTHPYEEIYLSTVKPSQELSLGDDVVRLKHMIEELDAINEETNGGSASGKLENEKPTTEKNESVVSETKEKIDKVLIPILNKISNDLKENLSTVSQTMTSMISTVPSPTETPTRIPITETTKKPDQSNAEVQMVTTVKEKETPVTEKETPVTGKETPVPEKETPVTGKKTPVPEKETPVPEKETPVTGKKTPVPEKEKEVEKEAPHIKNNFPCRIQGCWVCPTDGLQLNISTMPNFTLKVNLDNTKNNCFITKEWAIQGITLSTAGGPFLISAISPEKRKVANLIGQCTAYHGADIIIGYWTLSTAAKDFPGIFTSFETKTVIFKRGKKHKVKEESPPKS